MIVLVARYYGKQGQGDAIAAALHEMEPLVRANEPACKVYHAARSQENPDNFILYEEYEDEAALLAHRETPHFKEIIEGTIIPMLEKRERELYTAVTG